MPFDIASLGAQAAGGLINTGMGLLLEKHNDRRQLRQQEKLQNLQLKGQMQMTDYNMMKQLQMWKDTSYPAQVEQLKKAGLNPGLVYGMGGGGGTTTGTPSGAPGGASAPGGGGEIMGMGLMNLKMLQAQIENIQADTEKKKVESTKTAGVDTELATAQKEDTILRQIITKYTGKEIQEQFRQDDQLRDQQQTTKSAELQARTGTAMTLEKLWLDGKLYDKTITEIEGMLLQNAKTREETRRIYKDMELLEENIKGAKLDNIIKDLETRLQTETGIDKNSPSWIKIIGRLFVNLFK